MAIKIIILGIIIYIKGIFSSAETAYTYLNKAKFNQMSKRKNKIKERKINKLLENKLSIFGTTKVGVTFAELLASAFAAEVFMSKLETQFEEVIYIVETKFYYDIKSNKKYIVIMVINQYKDAKSIEEVKYEL